MRHRASAGERASPSMNVCIGFVHNVTLKLQLTIRKEVSATVLRGGNHDRNTTVVPPSPKAIYLTARVLLLQPQATALLSYTQASVTKTSASFAHVGKLY
eukprot:6202795-Pleurochrysis_carterae.AAC.2